MSMMVGALSLKAERSVVTPLFPVTAPSAHGNGFDAGEGAPTSSRPAAPRVTPTADPFATFHARVMALQDAINNEDGSEEYKDRMMKQWAALDSEALAGRPMTLAGAIGAMQRARHEFMQFHVRDDKGIDDPSNRLLLHLFDGVTLFLRQVDVKEAA